VTHELLNTKLHLEADQTSRYFNPCKYMNDISPICEKIEMSENELKNSKGFYDFDLLEKHEKEYGIETWRSAVKNTDVWNIKFIREVFAEDEDDDCYKMDEETSEESDVEEGNLTDIRSDLAQIVKFSFEYLIKKERKNRKEINKKKGYERAWVWEYRLVMKEYDGPKGDKNLLEMENQHNVFKWLNKKSESDTHFVLVNQDRRTIQAGEQVFYCYGCRSNRYLMLNYGFCFQNNRYDSYQIFVKMEYLPSDQYLTAENVIDFH
jgi:hypothetical protein